MPLNKLTKGIVYALSLSFLTILTACSTAPPEYITKTIVVTPPEAYLKKTPYPLAPEKNSNGANTFRDLEVYLTRYRTSLESCNLDKQQISEYLGTAKQTTRSK